jgi:hypothetical protein
MFAQRVNLGIADTQIYKEHTDLSIGGRMILTTHDTRFTAHGKGLTAHGERITENEERMKIMDYFLFIEMMIKFDVE